MIMHMCFAKTMISFPVSSHFDTSKSNLRFSTLKTSTWKKKEFSLKFSIKFYHAPHLLLYFSPVLLWQLLHCLSCICDTRYIFLKILKMKPVGSGKSILFVLPGYSSISFVTDSGLLMRPAVFTVSIRDSGCSHSVSESESSSVPQFSKTARLTSRI